MDLGDRLLWMGLGCVVGFILGYLVRSLREIKETVEHVDEAVSHENARKNERGAVRIPTLPEIGLFVVVALAFWSAISSQRASDEVATTQARLRQVSHCNQTYLSALLAAVNERTTSNSAANQANVRLQKAWYEFVNFTLHDPPHPKALQLQRANAYASSLHDFLDQSSETRTKLTDNPYPTDHALDACISNKEQ